MNYIPMEMLERQRSKIVFQWLFFFFLIGELRFRKFISEIWVRFLWYFARGLKNKLILP